MYEYSFMSPASVPGQLWFMHGQGEHPQAPGETDIPFPGSTSKRVKVFYARFWIKIFS